MGKEFLDDVTSLCNSMTEKANKMKKNVEQVQRAQSSNEPARATTDADHTNYFERAKASVSTDTVYQPLNDALGELGDDFMYQPITVAPNVHFVVRAVSALLPESANSAARSRTTK